MIREKLVSRIDQGYAKHISCGTGWDYILEELELKLNYIDPDYRIQQVKEKFGTLRFYYSRSEAKAEDRLAGEIMDDIVSAAVYDSAHTCEDCGKRSNRSCPPEMSLIGKRIELDVTVKMRYRGWQRTLCDTCAVARGYSLKEEEDDDEQ